MPGLVVYNLEFVRSLASIVILITKLSSVKLFYLLNIATSFSADLVGDNKHVSFPLVFGIIAEISLLFSSYFLPILINGFGEILSLFK